MTTINSILTAKGTGLHSGKECKVTLYPYDKQGIYFKFNENVYKALAEDVCDTSRCTMLDLNNNKIQTCEHLLAVIYALNINGILIETSEKEIPTFDGSGKYWLELLKDHIVNNKLDGFEISKPIHVSEDDSFIIAYPSEGFSIEYFLDYNHPLIGTSRFTFNGSIDNFSKYIAPSRTFAFIEEVEYLKANNLALGGNEENCIVVYKDKLSSQLRHKHEFTTHKILDLIGDISLCGMPLDNIKIIANKSGHKLNNLFARKLQNLLGGQ